jgi:hypothetical protein
MFFAQDSGHGPLPVCFVFDPTVAVLPHRQ